MRRRSAWVEWHSDAAFENAALEHAGFVHAGSERPSTAGNRSVFLQATFRF
jgi:hypothetical protein